MINRKVQVILVALTASFSLIVIMLLDVGKA
jgi:hypothetical protein